MQALRIGTRPPARPRVHIPPPRPPRPVAPECSSLFPGAGAEQWPRWATLLRQLCQIYVRACRLRICCLILAPRRARPTALDICLYRAIDETHAHPSLPS